MFLQKLKAHINLNTQRKIMFVYVCCLRNIEPHSGVLNFDWILSFDCQISEKNISRYFCGISNICYVLNYFLLFSFRWYHYKSKEKLTLKNKKGREDHREKEQNKKLRTNWSLIFKPLFLVKGFLCIWLLSTHRAIGHLSEISSI